MPDVSYDYVDIRLLTRMESNGEPFVVGTAYGDNYRLDFFELPNPDGEEKIYPGPVPIYPADHAEIRQESVQGHWIANSSRSEQGIMTFKKRVARAIKVPWNGFILMEPMSVRHDRRGRLTRPGPVVAEDLLGILAG